MQTIPAVTAMRLLLRASLEPSFSRFSGIFTGSVRG